MTYEYSRSCVDALPSEFPLPAGCVLRVGLPIVIMLIGDHDVGVGARLPDRGERPCHVLPFEGAGCVAPDFRHAGAVWGRGAADAAATDTTATVP